VAILHGNPGNVWDVPDFLDAAFIDQPGEMFERTIISLFGILRKKTGRQFPAVQVIAYTVAAGPLF
jgi:hypothetical protein